MMTESSLSFRARSDAPALDSALFWSQRGRPIVNRLVAPGDEDKIANLLAGLSARSLFLRYGLPMPRMAPESVAREAARLGQLHSIQHITAVAVACIQGVDQVIAVAELACDGGSPEVAELALVVADAYQREGIGSAICSYLVAMARRQGLATLKAMALAENTAVRRMLARSGAPYTAETRQGMTTIQIDLRAGAPMGAAASA
ncbi:MAG TPA: GNAT family N-acetyltransferase [Roseiflexaceae bacterium]|nr:GNAT family N-acetyltransferase [Roseiflexaceae bacterium]